MRLRAVAVITLLYGVALAAVVFTPIAWRLNRLTVRLYVWWLYRLRLPGHPTPEVFGFALNVLLFVPLGVLGTLLLGRWRWWLVLALGIATTLVIEFAQLFLPARFSDPSDLIANTLGTAVGIGVVAAWAAAGSRRTAQAAS